jgi:hypothetical protein
MNNQVPFLLKVSMVLLAINLIGQVILFCRMALTLNYSLGFPAAGISCCMVALVLALIRNRRSPSYSVGVIIGSGLSVNNLAVPNYDALALPRIFSYYKS